MGVGQGYEAILDGRSSGGGPVICCGQGSFGIRFRVLCDWCIACSM